MSQTSTGRDEFNSENDHFDHLQTLKTTTGFKLVSVPELGEQEDPWLKKIALSEEEWNLLPNDQKEFVQFILQFDKGLESTDRIWPDGFSHQQLALFIEVEGDQPLKGLTALHKHFKLPSQVSSSNPGHWIKSQSKDTPQAKVFTGLDFVIPILEENFKNFSDDPTGETQGVYLRTVVLSGTEAKTAGDEKAKREGAGGSERSRRLKSLAVLVKILLGYVGSHGLANTDWSRHTSDVLNAFLDTAHQQHRHISVAYRQLGKNAEDVKSSSKIAILRLIKMSEEASTNEVNAMERIVYIVLGILLTALNGKAAGEKHPEETTWVKLSLDFIAALQEALLSATPSTSHESSLSDSPPSLSTSQESQSLEELSFTEASSLSTSDFRQLSIIDGSTSGSRPTLEKGVTSTILQLFGSKGDEEEQKAFLREQDIVLDLHFTARGFTWIGKDQSQSEFLKDRRSAASRGIVALLKGIIASSQQEINPSYAFLVVGEAAWEALLIALIYLGVESLQTVRFKMNKSEEQTVVVEELRVQDVNPLGTTSSAGVATTFFFELGGVSCAFVSTIHPAISKFVPLLQKVVAETFAIGIALAASLTKHKCNCRLFVQDPSVLRLLQVAVDAQAELFDRKSFVYGFDIAEKKVAEESTDDDLEAEFIIEPLELDEKEIDQVFDGEEIDREETDRESDGEESDGDSDEEELNNSDEEAKSRNSDEEEDLSGKSDGEELDAKDESDLKLHQNNGDGDEDDDGQERKSKKVLYLKKEDFINITSSSKSLSFLASSYEKKSDLKFRILFQGRTALLIVIISPTEVRKLRKRKLYAFLTSDGLLLQCWSTKRNGWKVIKTIGFGKLRFRSELQWLVILDLLEFLEVRDLKYLPSSLQVHKFLDRNVGQAFNLGSERSIGLDRLPVLMRDSKEKVLTFPYRKNFGNTSILLLRFGASVGTQDVVGLTLYSQNIVQQNVINEGGRCAIAFSEEEGGICVYHDPQEYNSMTCLVDPEEILDDFRLVAILDPVTIALRSVTSSGGNQDWQCLLTLLSELDTAYLPSTQQVDLLLKRLESFPATGGRSFKDEEAVWKAAASLGRNLVKNL